MIYFSVKDHQRIYDASDRKHRERPAVKNVELFYIHSNKTRKRLPACPNSDLFTLVGFNHVLSVTTQLLSPNICVQYRQVKIFHHYRFFSRFRKISKKRLSTFSCPSVGMKQLGSHETDFGETWYLRVFLKICRASSSFI